MALFDFNDLIPDRKPELKCHLVFKQNIVTTKKTKTVTNPDGSVEKKKLIKESLTQPIPSWNEYVDLERGRNGYKGREFVRYWNKIGYDVFAKFLKTGIPVEEMKYSKLAIAIYWSDYVKRDIINICIKHVVDGIKQHNIWDDDDAIIDFHIALAGMAKEPSAHFFIYKLHVDNNDAIVPPRKKEVQPKRKPAK